MKIDYNTRVPWHPVLKKLIMQLKIAIAVVLISGTNIFASNTYSHAAKLTLNAENRTIEQVMDDIEMQSEFYFIFNQKQIDVNRIVDIQAEKSLISEILPELFKGTNVNYAILDRKILLTIENIHGDIATIANPVIDSQQNQITGTVTDASTGESMPGVNIVVKGTTIGTLTDTDGRYSISVTGGDMVLTFSFVGYKSQDINISGRTTINVQMEPGLETLEEVVVIGYGTVKKSDLTGAVSSIKGDVIANRETTQISHALQGAIPGIVVTRNNSAPGSTATIRIRGITTIGDSNPLIIVDGIPVSNINDVNPNDILDITVLKDAASASIYGSRAAAGVILVNTKRASLGERSFVYSYKYGFEKPTEMPRNVDVTRYLEMANEQRWNDSGNGANEYPTFSKEYVENYVSMNAQNPDLYPITDWNDLIFKDFAPRESHDINFITGTKNISTNASFSYEKENGLYYNNNYKRLTARINNDLTINNFLSASIDFYYKNAIRKLPSVSDIVYLTRRMPPQYAAEWSDGRVASGKIGDNPWGRLKYGGFNNNWTNQLGGKVSIDINPFKGFKFTTVVAPSMYFYKSKWFNKQVPYYAWDDPTIFEGYLDSQVITSLGEERNDNYNITTQFLANYQTALGLHNLNILAGNENYYAFYEDLGASRDEFELTSFPYLNLGSLEYRDNAGVAYENAYQSYFGRIMYNYANKYFLQTNIRLDGSSRFAKDYRWGIFPSFSAGWVISEESFMDNVPGVTYLKLRGSWGALGNERIGNYPYQATFAFTNALFYRGSNIVSAQGAAQQQYAIESISWEKTESTNFGFDASLFDNHFRFTGDYYVKTTKDMLLPLEIPDFIGFDNPDQNTGKMKTHGWEIEAGWNDSFGKFDLSVSANLSDFKSVMGDLGGTEFLGSQIKREGSEFNEWYGYKSAGLFQTQEEVSGSAVTSSAVKPGDVKYVDISGPSGVPDGLISPEYDRVLLGGSLPRYMYGGNILLGYRNFDFQLVIQGVGKQKARIEENMARPLQTQNTAVPEFIEENYWSMYNTSEKNLNAKYPRLSEVTPGNNYAMSDFWLFDGSYFRLKNITLGYNIPENLTERISIKDLRFYTSITDLFSLNKYPRGWDPEVAATSYPITTSFIFGLMVKF